MALLLSSERASQPCLWSQRTNPSLHVWNKTNNKQQTCLQECICSQRPSQSEGISIAWPTPGDDSVHGSSGFFPAQQEPLARQWAEHCLSHLPCWWHGNAQNTTEQTLSPSCCLAPPHHSCPACWAAEGRSKDERWRWHSFSTGSKRVREATGHRGTMLF